MDPITFRSLRDRTRGPPPSRCGRNKSTWRFWIWTRNRGAVKHADRAVGALRPLLSRRPRAERHGFPFGWDGVRICAAVSTETCRIPAHPTRLGSPSMRDRGWPSAMNGLSVGFADGSGVSCQSELRSSRPPLEKDKQYAVRGDHLFAARLVCMSRRREALDFCCRR